jgi:hypothetical protein
MKRSELFDLLSATAVCSLLVSFQFGCSKQPSEVGSGAGGANAEPLQGAGGSSHTATDDAGLGGSAGASGITTLNINFDVKMEPDLPEEAAAPTADANCGKAGQKTKRLPADVLLVLDRSASMNYSIAGTDCYCSQAEATATGYGRVCPDTTNCKTRWNSTKDGLKATLTNSTYVNWGLKFFMTPKAAECGVTPDPEVPVGADTAAKIQEQIEGADQSLSTPTTAAINAAVAYLKTVDDANKKFILLATDGEPNCGTSARTGKPDLNTVDVTGATEAMAAAKAAGFTAYVIGIGPSTTNLNTLAQAGAGRNYFPATSPEQLAEALSSISTIVGSCSFASDESPPDPNNVAVYVNKQQISRSDSNGWKYGGSDKEIVLTGQYCDDILKGTETDVQILFGCPGETHFPQDIL